MSHQLPRGLGHFVNTKNPRVPPPTTGVGTFFELKKTFAYTLLPRGLGHFLNIKNPRVPPPTTRLGTFFETFFGNLSAVIKSIVALPDLLGTAGRAAGRPAG